MALFEEHCGKGFGYAIWRMEESLDALALQLHNPALLAAAQARFSHPVKQMEFLAVRLLVTRYLGLDEMVEYSPSGKPFLTSRSHFISISHTRGYVALAWHHEREAGVDIEQHGDRVTRVRRRFVNDEEEASLDRNRELEALLLHWSAKETVYKILDIQGLDLREHLSLHPFVVKEAGHFTMEERYTPAKSCFDITYLVNPDFVFTCCFH